MPYGREMSPYDGPKSGCSRRDVPPIDASHALLRGCTGRRLASECHTLSAGSIGHDGAPGTGRAWATGPAGRRATTTVATTAAVRLTLSVVGSRASAAEGR